MTASKRKLKICDRGHKFYKSSDCPTCPVCERERKPKQGFLSSLSAPARRALENIGITTVNELSNYTEKEILNLHGMGPSSIPKLKNVMEQNGLSFKNSAGDAK
ncbi:MAG: RNA polymerase alpha subunit C-terminal domain-containing protein [Melioribacteraceae bacterium]|nr:RNA polymerase alpha subunit C-terminal domain-containing protein [Melioribacteraceae bacterium]MCF8353685.1 RNA polymerase alpha subunit C-terminal domain-containing protein [Melioribacteraceae bacterium]MCF8394467.1 RNA polymerase alpha subunit C-terminal domain-containing protein [Melioribacteraceae bacterium]MCF8418601.1 RNA polymerase alpha subunit C-terminal domain-containing protein [Melioribacteraceae bacterium]